MSRSSSLEHIDLTDADIDRMTEIQSILHSFPEPDLKPTVAKTSSAVNSIIAALSLITKEVSGLQTDIKSSRDDIRDFGSK